MIVRVYEIRLLAAVTLKDTARAPRLFASYVLSPRMVDSWQHVWIREGINAVRSLCSYFSV